MKTSPVPAHDGCGRNDDERVLPSGPDPSSDYPEEFIEWVDARARMSTLQRDELLTQSKLLEKETSPLAKEAGKHSKATRLNMVKIYNRTVAAAMLLISLSAGVLANHIRYIYGVITLTTESRAWIPV
jgi:hypothetical protein